jgi:hypothetical protein
MKRLRTWILVAVALMILLIPRGQIPKVNDDLEGLSQP